MVKTDATVVTEGEAALRTDVTRAQQPDQARVTVRTSGPTIAIGAVGVLWRRLYHCPAEVSAEEEGKHEEHRFEIPVSKEQLSKFNNFNKNYRYSQS